jgi:peptide/nickel transport system permease protein
LCGGAFGGIAWRSGRAPSCCSCTQYIYAPPQALHLFHEGEFIGPFVYGFDYKLNMENLQRQYVPNPEKVQPLRFFCRGDDYRFWGQVEGNLHLFCPAEGGTAFLFGTDRLGRDMLSRVIYGARISLGVSFAAVLLAMTLGISLGLLSGYLGGTVDAVIMRIADVQLTFPAILIALLIDGLSRSVLPRDLHSDIWFYVLVLAIGLSFWVQYARTVRGSVMVERNKEYVQAARVIGIPPLLIMVRHVLPNVMGPVLVIATINLAIAVITEATLSFLGVGVPPTSPSLGTLVRVGQDFLFSGSWWMTIFPGAALAILVLAVNLLGDWLRDALNPKLR